MCPDACPRGLSPTVLGVAELSARLAQQERNDAPAGSLSVIMVCCWIQTAAWSCQLCFVAAPERFSKLSIQPSKRSAGCLHDPGLLGRSDAVRCCGSLTGAEEEVRPVGVAGLDERLDWAGSAPGTVPLTQASLETSSENDLVGSEKRQVIQTAELGPKIAVLARAGAAEDPP